MRQPQPQTPAPLDPDPQWPDGYIEALRKTSSIRLPSSGYRVYSQPVPSVKPYDGTFHAQSLAPAAAAKGPTALPAPHESGS